MLTTSIPRARTEWMEVTNTHPTVVVRTPPLVPWENVQTVHWLAGSSAKELKNATAFLKRGHQLGRAGVTCKIFAVRLGQGGVDGSHRDFACLVERVERTCAQQFRGRRTSAAVEYGIVRAIVSLVQEGYKHSALTPSNIGLVGTGSSADVKLLSIRHIQRAHCTNARLLAIVMAFPLARRLSRPGGGLHEYVMAAVRGEGVFRVNRDVMSKLSRPVSVDGRGRPRTPVYAWCGHPESSRIRRQWSHGSTADWRMIDFADTTTYQEVVTWATRYGAPGVSVASLAAQQACVDMLEKLTDDGHVMLPLDPMNVMFVNPGRSSERLMFVDIYGTARARRRRPQQGTQHMDKEASMAAHLMALTWPLLSLQPPTAGRNVAAVGAPMLDRLHAALPQV
jgi:hypothetical protein